MPSNLVLPVNLYRQRVEDIARFIDDLDADCAVISGPSVKDLGVQIYGDGMERVTAAIITKDGGIRWVVPQMEVPHILYRQAPCASAESLCPFDDQLRYDDGIDAGLVKLAEALNDYTSTGKIMVEPHFPAVWSDFLSQAGSRIDISVEPFVQMLQANAGMHPAELRLMDYSLELAEAGMQMMLQAVSQGLYPAGALLGLGDKVKQMMMARFGFDIITCSVLMGPWPGPESYMEHYIPHLADRVRPGKANILFAFSELYRYYAELEQLLLIGEPGPRIREIHQVLREATQFAMAQNMFRAGISVSDLDQMVYNYIAERLGTQGINHRSGHMIKTGHHFLGVYGGITRGSGMELLSGCRYCWEPGFSDQEFGTVRSSVPFDVLADGTVQWLRDPVRPIEDFIIPAAAPIQSPQLAFLDQLLARESQLRAELAVL